MEEDLKQSFQQIVNDFGPDVINDKNLANIVADYYSFDRNPAVRNILKAIVSDGYAIKVSQLKTSKGDPSIDLERYAGEIEQSWGYRKEQVIYVLSCIASSIGIEYKIDNSNKQNQQPISFPPNSTIDNKPISPNQNNQQTQNPFVQKNKVKYLLWNLPIVFILVGIIYFLNSSSSEEDRLALDHAKECYDSGDYNTAFEIYDKYAKLDSVRGMNGLGNCYCEGKGVKQDYKEAMKWYLKAAEQGYANAQYNIGLMYFNGEGVPVDYEEARKWYTKAAEQGFVKAQYCLGFMYENGKGVPVDYVEARKWYTKAAEQGDAVAQTNLGIMCYEGDGMPINYEEAHKWYTKAAEQGYAVAQNNLGNMYVDGRGVSVDYKEACKWLTKAADQGYALAQNNLGNMYMRGDGVGKDYKEATKWYRKAAEQGYVNAQCQLGCMYLLGQGVPIDYEEGYNWIIKAAEQGDADAQEILRTFEAFNNK